MNNPRIGPRPSWTNVAVVLVVVLPLGHAEAQVAPSAPPGAPVPQTTAIQAQPATPDLQPRGVAASPTAPYGASSAPGAAPAATQGPPSAALAAPNGSAQPFYSPVQRQPGGYPGTPASGPPLYGYPPPNAQYTWQPPNTPAPSATPAHAIAPPVRVTNWSVGAGIGYGGYANALYGSNLYQATVQTAIFLERRLWNQLLYLMVQPQFNYRRYGQDGSTVQGLTKTHQRSYGISSGIRWVGNPGETVEFGMTHLLEMNWYDDAQSGPRSRVDGYYSNTTRANTGAYEIGFSTGIVAETRLMQQLWLRIHASFLRIAFQKQHTDYNDDDGHTNSVKQTSTDVTLLALPMLELRLTW